MVELDGKVTQITEQILDNGLTKFGAGFLGFWAGVDQKYYPLNPQNSNWGTSYPFNKQGLGDMISGVFGNGIAHKIVPGYTGVAGQAFLPFGWINIGLAVAVVAWFISEMTKGVLKKLFTLVTYAGAGYAAGGVFDPSGISVPSGRTGTYSPSASATAYANTASAVNAGLR